MTSARSSRKSSFPNLPVKPLPSPPPFLKMVGPSIILLGLGLGSGEVILWPYLTSRYGMGIIWAAILGLTFQFFMNMEIERYALVNGESVFVGLKRRLWWSPWWFLLSTFIPWIWPGIIAAGGVALGALFGIQDTRWLTIGLLVGIGLILTLGPVLYKTVEMFQRLLVMISVPTILIITWLLAKQEHWTALAHGLIGQGDGYVLLPAGISIASFLAAFAYSGAGGNLNLAQAYYIKEKGYGMGKYAGRITSLLLGKAETLRLSGTTFDHTPSQLARFRTWWHNINLEHFLVFWVTGAVTIVCLALLAFVTRFGVEGASTGIRFVVEEAQVVGSSLFPAVGALFLLIAGATLFGTQLTVFDATSRILAENTVLIGIPGLRSPSRLRPLYYIVLWLQILAGILVFAFGFTEPFQLLVLAAVLNSCAMFAHTALTLWLNVTTLREPVRTPLWRRAILLVACCFYGGFGIFSLWQMFQAFTKA
jgi:hypothetical protein